MFKTYCKIYPSSELSSKNNYIIFDNQYVFTDYFLKNVKQMSADYKKTMKFIDIINILRKEFQINENNNICEVLEISCGKLNINQEKECLIELAKKCIVAL